MKKMYTAQEMREMALVEESYRWDVVAKMLRQGADMMEREAAREKSSQVGNAAKMREALEALVGVIDNYDYKNPLWWHSGAKGVKPLKDARAAIAEPSRNCDAFSKAQVLEMFEDRSLQKEDTIEWLFDEAKGESK